MPEMQIATNAAKSDILLEFVRKNGKTMKIAQSKRSSEKEALSDLLMNYQDTSHPATGVTPAAMLLRDGAKSTFPKRAISAEQAEEARDHDEELKKDHQKKINASKKRVPSEF